MSAADHRILLRRDGAAYTVTIDPPTADHPLRRFADYRDARGYAGGLRMVKGWILIDECAAPAARPAR